jgi:Biogenesis of lysosome-related organelles complex 1 subunit 3
VIDGEAPESDESDDEIISFSNLNRSSAAYEVTESFSPAKTKPRNHSKNVAINQISEFYIYNRNDAIIFFEFAIFIDASCSSMLNEFIQAAAQSSSRQLIDTDHMLMHTQATLQQAGQAIKKFNQASTDLSHRLDNILSANFIPPIKSVP